MLIDLIRVKPCGDSAEDIWGISKVIELAALVP